MGSGDVVHPDSLIPAMLTYLLP